jgi:hypothetical protein
LGKTFGGIVPRWNLNNGGTLIMLEFFGIHEQSFNLIYMFIVCA